MRRRKSGGGPLSDGIIGIFSRGWTEPEKPALSAEAQRQSLAARHESFGTSRSGSRPDNRANLHPAMSAGKAGEY